MKKLMSVLVLFVFIGLSACGNDNLELATYSLGKTQKKINLKTIKEDFKKYLATNPQLAEDTVIHKSYMTDRYVIPQLMLFEELSGGMTNSADYKNNFANENRKKYFMELNAEGVNIITNQFAKEKYEVVKASHILIKAEKASLDNQNDEKLVIAKNIMESLKQSKNIEKDFEKIAREKSEDVGTAQRGGDLGYFTKSVMVKEFEEAVMAQKSKSLVPNIVPSQFGYHIIFVSDPVSKKSISEIEKKTGSQDAARLIRVLQNNYFVELKNTKVKDLYTITPEQKISVDGKEYTVNELPNEVQLVEAWGKKFTWGEALEVINLFVPTFKLDMNIAAFQQQMVNYNNFLFIIAPALIAKVDKSSNFKKKLADYEEENRQNVAIANFQTRFTADAQKQISDADLQNHYNLMKANYMKEDKGKQVQMSFDEAKSRVEQEVMRNKQMEVYEAWKKEAIVKYGLKFNDKNLEVLKKELQKELNKVLATQAEQQKKVMQNQAPQQLKIKPE